MNAKSSISLIFLLISSTSFSMYQRTEKSLMEELFQKDVDIKKISKKMKTATTNWKLFRKNQETDLGKLTLEDKIKLLDHSAKTIVQHQQIFEFPLTYLLLFLCSPLNEMHSKYGYAKFIEPKIYDDFSKNYSNYINRSMFNTNHRKEIYKELFGGKLKTP